MVKGDKVYVVENYLVEERTASLLAGEIGLAVRFECRADAARVHVYDQNDNFWEIPTTAVCTVPEGHLSNLHDEPCPACGLRLIRTFPIVAPEGADRIRPFRPPADVRSCRRANSMRVTCPRVEGEVQYNDGWFAEIQLIGLEGADKGFLLGKMQVHREDTIYTAEEFRQLFRVGAKFEIQTAAELQPLDGELG
jgi:hypothetical protein